MTQAEFKKRTMRLALDVVEVLDTLPPGRAADHFGGQLLRCSSSVAANYRAACRAKSRADMASKLNTVLEEGDETQFWLELLVRSGKLGKASALPIHRQANEIIAMTVASIQTLRSRAKQPKLRKPKPVEDAPALKARPPRPKSIEESKNRVIEESR